MKKVSNKYVNYGIAFALLGILVFSLSLNRMEGFTPEEKPTDEKKKKTTDEKATPKIPPNLDEALIGLQHLAHLLNKGQDTSKVV